jgi:vitamin B12 transporter
MNLCRHRPAALCGLGLLVLSSACVAPRAAASTQLPAVVVTASRSPQSLPNTLSDVRIIDAEAIREAGASTLTELLRVHGGVEVAANGGPGQVSSVFMRGANANHVVLLVDGVRVNSATAGLNAWENIPLAQIERIEVVRGAASSLYGADAIGGVIQIFTRRGVGAQVRVGAGSWGAREASVGVGREFGASRLSVHAGASEARGFSATNERHPFSFDPDIDPYRNTHLNVAFEHEWATAQSLLARVMNSAGATFFDCGPGNDDVNRQRLGSYSIESRNRLSADWHSSLRLARGTDDSRTVGNCAGSFRTDQDQLQWQNDVHLLGGQLVAGAELRREHVGSDTAYTVATRETSSMFGGYAVVLGEHLLQGALREDRTAQYGGRTTGNMAYGYRIAPPLRVSAGVGTAFKAPSFNDLYYPSSFGFQGNPQLRPERSRSVEVAANFDADGVQAGLVIYQSRVRDLIVIDSGFTTVINLNRARIRGATLSGSFTQAPWALRGEVTHQNAVDETSAKQLPRRARRYGSASLGYAPGPWRAALEWLAQGARFDVASNSAGSRMGGYGLLNLHAGYAFSQELALLVRLNNATDRRYELAQGYNTPSRNVFVALEFAER